MADIYLRHFTKNELLLSPQDASRVLRFFFPAQPMPSTQLTDEDVGFAQALLLQAIDSSTQMGYVQILFDKFYAKPPSDFSFLKDLAVAFCKRAARNWFRHATGADLANPQIYDSVRATIARNFSSVWSIRCQSGELTY